MDTFSSGEELVIKTRKPYTITKQRERWTEEEHNRFTEALKLYGRAWQRIEEHIGTKTAVQIRSHAQKFFTKLEKEALSKGVPVGRALNIEIPPPRPKRKPSNPYPRKTATGAHISQVGGKDGKLSTSVSSFCPGREVLDLEKEPLPEKTCGNENPGIAGENKDEDNCSEVFTFDREASSGCLTSPNENSKAAPVASRNSCTYREFVPATSEIINQRKTSESSVADDVKGKAKLVKFDSNHKGNSNFSELSKSDPSPLHEERILEKKMEEVSPPENFGIQSSSDVKDTQNYPRHVPVHVLDGSLGICGQNVSQGMSHQEYLIHQMGAIRGHLSPFTNPAACTTTEYHINASGPSIHQSYPNFHSPFTPVCYNQDDYRSLFHMSTFSSLLVSSLLQNPAAHAAATFAAAFWPCPNTEASADPPGCNPSSFPSRQINPTPSMAAVTAATVTAATAWWAAHGMLPLCSPFHSGFSCPPASTTTTAAGAGLFTVNNNDRKERALHDVLLQHRQLDQEYAEGLQKQQSASKSPTLLSSDSEEIEGAKLDAGQIDDEHDKAAAVTDLHDSSKPKNRKMVDRSSCGSNTTSGSEAEKDALDKHEEAKEEPKEPDVSHPSADTSNRRCRNSSNATDSWKEVSEEGRLAFQALFSREVLPQSFSLRCGLKNKGCQRTRTENDELNGDDKSEEVSQLDFNRRADTMSASHEGVERNVTFGGTNEGAERLLETELWNSKLKARRTGFKPYKRCSVEAKVSNRMASSSSQPGEDKGPKRIRLEEKAST